MNFSCVKASERASVDVTAAHAIACQMRTFRLFEIRHLLSLAWGLLKENKNSKHECEQSLQKYPCLQFDLYFLVFNQGLRIWTYALACKCLSSNRDDTRVLAKIRVPWNNVTEASSTVRGRKGNDWDFLGRCPCSASNLLFWGGSTVPHSLAPCCSCPQVRSRALGEAPKAILPSWWQCWAGEELQWCEPRDNFIPQCEPCDSCLAIVRLFLQLCRKTRWVLSWFST